MKKTKLQKGITLIALLITVILLLILAAVTIGSVKENDIIGYAQNAATDYEKKQNEEQGKISEYKEGIKDVLGDSYVTGTATVGTIVSKNSTINGNKPSSDNPVIPAGFKAINVTTPGHESRWDAEDGPEVDEGLVIEDNDGNQFVWIPVPNIDEFAKLQEGSNKNYRGVLYALDPEQADVVTADTYREPVNLTDMKTWESETLLSNGRIVEAGTSYIYDGQDVFNLFKMGTYSEIYYQNKFNKMVASVAKYGGFYVGRYETSLDEDKTMAQSKEGQPVMNYTEWHSMYVYSEKYSQKGVISEMIWGCQWDAMLKFILTGDEAEHVTAGDKVSHELDNPYKTGGTNYSEIYKGEIRYQDIASNIYDLEGNVYEFTQESDSTKWRVNRGACCFENVDWCSPSIRGRSDPLNSNNLYAGSRMSLYIEL